jgi:hypothetical protein
MLGVAIAVVLWSESRRTHDHILLSQNRDSPKPGGSGPRIYIPQEQGGPVIAPDTGLHFRRLLRLSGLYSGSIRTRLHTVGLQLLIGLGYNTSARTE